MFRVKQSLTTRVLLLVAVPVCFQLVFVVFLLNLQREAEAETRVALKERGISDRLNKITRNVYQMWYQVDNPGTVIVDSVNLYRNKLEGLLVGLRSQYVDLRLEVKDDQELTGTIDRSLGLIDVAQGIIDSTFEELRQQRFEVVLKDWQPRRDKMKTVFKALMDDQWYLISQHDRKYTETSESRQSESRKLVINTIIFFCLLNIVASGLIAVLLVRGITGRLSVLSANAARVAKHEPLRPPIPGDDEIAALDKSFHQMARELDDSARSKQEMVSMITHDLRSPLSVICGMVEILQSGRATLDDEKGKNLLTLAERNGERMMRLIEDLLDVEKIRSGMMTITPESVCLAESFENVKLALEAYLQEQGLSVKIEDTDIFVSADSGKLDRVLFNLVSNAIKYSPAGGVITLAAEKDGGKIHIKVSDQGQGIPADKLKTIFGRFQQASSEDAKVGSGLGLTICKAIVEMHGGRIWATSEVNVGSTFHFTLTPA